MSARGSINFPKSLIKSNFLAIVPSKISVIPEIEKTIIASTYFPLESNVIIIGINKNLIIVKIFGTFQSACTCLCAIFGGN